MQDTEVVNFGIFERDKPPEAKLIATSIEEFDEKIEEKTGCVHHLKYKASKIEKEITNDEI